jgi:lipoprotein-anchoring transpeptidase ErfK/SrfK
MIRPQQHNTIHQTVKLRRLILLFGAVATVIICSSCEEVPPYAQQPRIAAGYPPETPPGWWDDAGVSGSPKIVVNIGDQKAYFYKGKHLVGETTVSTGKPGFSTPPGRYQVLSKSPDHVSTLFGDYVDDYGNVVRSNIDSRKDRRPPGTHFDGAYRRTRCSSGGYDVPGLRSTFAASHGCIRLPRGMAGHSSKTLL